MSFIKFIKSLFKKELDSILAPLDKIHTNLSNFIASSVIEMDSNRGKVLELQVKNESINTEIQKANTVLDNIHTLLGKA